MESQGNDTDNNPGQGGQDPSGNSNNTDYGNNNSNISNPSVIWPGGSTNNHNSSKNDGDGHVVSDSHNGSSSLRADSVDSGDGGGKRPALAGQWRTPPVPFFPTTMHHHQQHHPTFGMHNASTATASSFSTAPHAASTAPRASSSSSSSTITTASTASTAVGASGSTLAGGHQGEYAMQQQQQQQQPQSAVREGEGRGMESAFAPCPGTAQASSSAANPQISTTTPTTTTTSSILPLGAHQLPHTTEDYAKALQEAYRRGAEAAAAMAAAAAASAQPPPAPPLPIIMDAAALQNANSNHNASTHTLESFPSSQNLIGPVQSCPQFQFPTTTASTAATVPHVQPAFVLPSPLTVAAANHSTHSAQAGMLGPPAFTTHEQQQQHQPSPSHATLMMPPPAQANSHQPTNIATLAVTTTSPMMGGNSTSQPPTPTAAAVAAPSPPPPQQQQQHPSGFLRTSSSTATVSFGAITTMNATPTSTNTMTSSDPTVLSNSNHNSISDNSVAGAVSASESMANASVQAPSVTQQQQQNQQQQQQHRSMSLPDMTSFAAQQQQEEEKRQKRLARNRASARLRRLKKKNLVDAYETEVGILESTLQNLRHHAWGQHDQAAALAEALGMDRGQQVLDVEQRKQAATDILQQQLDYVEHLEQLMQEQYVLYHLFDPKSSATNQDATAPNQPGNDNGNDNDSDHDDLTDLKEMMQLSDLQIEQLRESAAGWNQEWEALQTVKSSLQALKDHTWLWNDACHSSIAEPFLSLLNKNQISKFLLWCDNNAEVIDELDLVNATANTSVAPYFAFGGSGSSSDNRSTNPTDSNNNYNNNNSMSGGGGGSGGDSVMSGTGSNISMMMMMMDENYKTLP